MQVPLDDYFKIRFGENSISFFDKNKSKYHYTLHYGINSGILDIHKTNTPSGREPLFALSHFSIKRILVYFRMLNQEILEFIFKRQVLLSELWEMDVLVNPISDPKVQSELIKIVSEGKIIETRKNINLSALELVGLTPKRIKINDNVNAYIAFKPINNQIKTKGIILTLPRKHDPFHVIYISLDRIENFGSVKKKELQNILGKKLSRMAQLRLFVQLRTLLEHKFN